MTSIKTLELDDQLHTELTAAGEKLVVIYYSAAWCGPCKKMKPVIEALSKKHPNVVFLTLDVDTCQETAIAQGITAMPTFAFHRNIEKIDVLQGADPIALEEKIIQHKEHEGGVSGYVDLGHYISMSQSECMNDSDGHPFANIFKENGKYLQSDSDPQLILSVTFQQPVKIHSLRMKAPAHTGPKDIKIFINQPNTLGFDAADSRTPVQELTLSPNQLDGSSIHLQFVKFQSVTNIQLYIKNNQKGEKRTVIHNLNFVGSVLPSTNMGDFKRVPGKKVKGEESRPVKVWQKKEAKENRQESTGYA